MSIRYSGLASRSFIIGSRLWPPAMMRASGPRCLSAAIAPSTLVARSYSNGAGVCTIAPFGVLHRRSGADDRRTRQRLGHRRATARVERAGGPAPVRRVAERRAGRARRRDRRFPPQPGEGQRSLRIDLADPRRPDRPALREVAKALGRGAGVEAVDQTDGVRHPGLLDEQALEQIHAGVEVLVDRLNDVIDGRALLDDSADP